MTTHTTLPTETQTIATPWILDGKRFDVVAQSLSDAWFQPPLPRSAVQKAIAEGTIILQGSQTSSSARVSKGDPITFTSQFFTSFVTQEERVFPEGEEPVVLIDNNTFIVLYKPVFWLTHGVSNYPTEASLEDWLLKKALIPTNLPSNGRVHRLDRNTSGVIVYAKTTEAQGALKSLFQARRVTKTYLALVEGNLLQTEGVINAPITRKPGSFKRMVAVEGQYSSEKEPKQAETAYRVIARTPEYDLLLVTPKTGRTHQIRVHMEYLGHPLAGDSLYGGKKTLLERQFLHAWQLQFFFQGQNYCFTAPLPKDLKKALVSLDEQSLTRYDNEALQSIGLKQQKGFFSLLKRLYCKS